ncbi:MAG: SDR family oxidoreductase [Planctomycetales bacterium]|nr:SDR family oxidoreductase [Planctomycetales bacterium]
MAGQPTTDNSWVLILGASSGFGEATARHLSKSGYNVAGVHLDRKATLPHVEEVVAAIRDSGREALFWNANAAEDARRAEVVSALAEKSRAPDGKTRPIRLLFHSLAFGALKPFVSSTGNGAEEAITRASLEMTLDVMANSLVYWTQDLVAKGLLAEGSRVLAMTSAGGARVWPTYGAVSAAKSALESYVRQLAVELAPRGIAVNAIRAGVTDTPALRKIPGHVEMIEAARKGNPHRRLTRPEDVAGMIGLLCHPDSSWTTGNVIGVDGAEFVV